MTTIAEIAKIVGHSPSTVSRALNNSGYVNQDTRQRILWQAVEIQLQAFYQPELLNPVFA